MRTPSDFRMFLDAIQEELDAQRQDSSNVNDARQQQALTELMATYSTLRSARATPDDADATPDPSSTQAPRLIDGHVRPFRRERR